LTKSLKQATTKLPGLLHILLTLLMKQAVLLPQHAKAGDAFHQVLNGLARKLPHDTSVYLKASEKILN
jgi:hypothetical protein